MVILVFVCAGLNAMDLKTGRSSVGAVAQVEAAVKAIDGTLRKSGLSIGDVVEAEAFMKKGTDVEQVRQDLPRRCRPYSSRSCVSTRPPKRWWWSKRIQRQTRCSSKQAWSRTLRIRLMRARAAKR